MGEDCLGFDIDCLNALIHHGLYQLTLKFVDAVNCDNSSIIHIDLHGKGSETAYVGTRYFKLKQLSQQAVPLCLFDI